MHVPFLDPMFDARQSVLGVPAELVVLLVAAALAAAGMVLLRRIARVEREPRSFRATAGQDATGQLARGSRSASRSSTLLVLVLLLVR